MCAAAAKPGLAPGHRACLAGGTGAGTSPRPLPGMLPTCLQCVWLASVMSCWPRGALHYANLEALVAGAAPKIGGAMQPSIVHGRDFCSWQHPGPLLKYKVIADMTYRPLPCPNLQHHRIMPGKWHNPDLPACHHLDSPPTAPARPGDATGGQQQQPLGGAGRGAHAACCPGPQRHAAHGLPPGAPGAGGGHGRGQGPPACHAGASGGSPQHRVVCLGGHCLLCCQVRMGCPPSELQTGSCLKAPGHWLMPWTLAAVGRQQQFKCRCHGATPQIAKQTCHAPRRIAGWPTHLAVPGAVIMQDGSAWNPCRPLAGGQHERKEERAEMQGHHSGNLPDSACQE